MGLLPVVQAGIGDTGYRELQISIPGDNRRDVIDNMELSVSLSDPAHL